LTGDSKSDVFVLHLIDQRNCDETIFNLCVPTTQKEMCRLVRARVNHEGSYLPHRLTISVAEQHFPMDSPDA
jgi:hypothetical protein